jgi:hypothetical protein
LDPHDRILVEERSRIGAVGLNAPHYVGGVNENLWSMLPEQPIHCVCSRQIVFPAFRNDHIMATTGLELLDNVASEETSAAGYDDALIG